MFSCRLALRTANKRKPLIKIGNGPRRTVAAIVEVDDGNDDVVKEEENVSGNVYGSPVISGTVFISIVGAFATLCASFGQSRLK